MCYISKNSSKIVPVDELDIGMSIHERERSVVLESIVERSGSLSALNLSKTPRPSRDAMQMGRQRNVVGQQHPNAVRVQPLLPAIFCQCITKNLAKLSIIPQFLCFTIILTRRSCPMCRRVAKIRRISELSVRGLWS